MKPAPNPHYLLLILVLALSTGCLKNTYYFGSPYVGDWDFTVIRTKFNVDSIGQYSRDTVHFTGEIDFGEPGHSIQVHYTENDFVTLKITGDGELYGFPSPYSSGAFQGMDSLSLYLRYGGLGGALIHEVEGSRVK